jgi:transcription initiation factor TFIID TATA-box-binding protein
LKQELDLR